MLVSRRKVNPCVLQASAFAGYWPCASHAEGSVQTCDGRPNDSHLAGDAGDNAADGLLDDWTDQAEQRAWFLDATLGN